MNLSWGHLNQEAVPAWTQLTNLLAECDHTAEFYEAEDLAEELRESGTDPALDTRAVWADQTLVAYGQIRVSHAPAERLARAWLSGGVHPQWRNKGIGRDLLTWCEQRGNELAGQRHPGLNVEVLCSAGVAGSSAQALLDRHGFAYARSFLDMVKPSLADSEPAPEGVHRHGDDEWILHRFDAQWSEPVRLVRNRIFAAHWGSSEFTPDMWRDTVEGRPFRARCSVVAVNSHGQVDAFLVGTQYEPEDMYVRWIGAVPAARGKGLAKACLRQALSWASAEGFSKATLQVDSENPAQAGRLYESVGFVPGRTLRTYRKMLPA